MHNKIRKKTKTSQITNALSATAPKAATSTGLTLFSLHAAIKSFNPNASPLVFALNAGVAGVAGFVVTFTTRFGPNYRNAAEEVTAKKEINLHTAPQKIIGNIIKCCGYINGATSMLHAYLGIVSLLELPISYAGLNIEEDNSVTSWILFVGIQGAGFLLACNNLRSYYTYYVKENINKNKENFLDFLANPKKPLNKEVVLTGFLCFFGGLGTLAYSYFATISAIPKLPFMKYLIKSLNVKHGVDIGSKVLAGIFLIPQTVTIIFSSVAEFYSFLKDPKRIFAKGIQQKKVMGALVFVAIASVIDTCYSGLGYFVAVTNTLATISLSFFDETSVKTRVIAAVCSVSAAIKYGVFYGHRACTEVVRLDNADEKKPLLPIQAEEFGNINAVLDEDSTSRSLPEISHFVPMPSDTTTPVSDGASQSHKCFGFFKAMLPAALSGAVTRCVSRLSHC